MEEDIIGMSDASLILQGGDVIAGTLAGALVGLVADDITLTADTTLAEVEAAEADFNTYARLAITWSDPTIADDGTVEWIGTLDEFRPTDGLAPNSIWGAFVVDAGETVLLGVSRLNAPPSPLEVVTDSLIIRVRYRPAADSLINVLT